MPNWITNRFTSDAETIGKIVALVKSEESEFDFNKVIPMPGELRGTTAPTKILPIEEYITDTTRGITQTMSKELIKKFGFDNWYDWAISNWGTKWNCCDVFIGDDYIEFNTAWSNPMPIFLKLSEMFSDVEFEVMYADEDFGYNTGKYTLQNGEMYSMDIPDGGSKEAYELAIEVQGDNDYFTYDVFLEVNENEDLSDFHTTLIEISYERERVVTNEMPLIILNEFLRLALEREDYEFASKVRDVIKSKELVGNSI